MVKRLTKKQRDAIAEDLAAGHSLGKTAKRHGVSKGSVSNIKDEYGISLDRSATAAATAAVVHDHAERRARLAEQQLKLAEAATKRALDMIEQATAREASLISGTSINGFAALDRYDSNTQNLSAFDTWIATMTGAAVPEPGVAV